MKRKIYDEGVGIIVKHGNKFLLGLRADGQGWSCAGGKQEEYESPMDAAIRELLEEFGIKVKALDLKYLGKTFAPAVSSGENITAISNYFLYNVKDLAKVGECPRDEEMSRIQWMNFNQIFQIDTIFPPTLVALNKFMYITED